MANKKRCKLCGGYFKPAPGVTQQTPAGFFCCYDHMMKWVNEKQQADAARKIKKTASATRKKAKEARSARIGMKKRGLRWQHKVTQPVFNRMRVLEELLWFKERGLEPVCISCNKPIGGDQWSNGHLKTRGAQSGLRYDPKNCFLQHNVRCNKNLSGDIEGTKTTRGYKVGLRERFGEVEGQEVIDYCESNTQTVKWIWEELEKMRASFRARIRELEKELS